MASVDSYFNIDESFAINDHDTVKIMQQSVRDRDSVSFSVCLSLLSRSLSSLSLSLLSFILSRLSLVSLSLVSLSLVSLFRLISLSLPLPAPFYSSPSPFCLSRALPLSLFPSSHTQTLSQTYTGTCRPCSKRRC